MKLFRLRQRSTGHTGQFLVKAEEILEGDRRQRMVLALHLDALFSLDGLVKTLAVAPSRHLATRKLIDDDYFAVSHNIVFVELEDELCLNGVA